MISKVLFFNITQKFSNLSVQLSIFLIDLFVGTYRLSSHARLEAFVKQTKLTFTTANVQPQQVRNVWRTYVVDTLPPPPPTFSPSRFALSGKNSRRDGHTHCRLLMMGCTCAPVSHDTRRLGYKDQLAWTSPCDGHTHCCLLMMGCTCAPVSHDSRGLGCRDQLAWTSPWDGHTQCCLLMMGCTCAPVSHDSRRLGYKDQLAWTSPWDGHTRCCLLMMGCTCAPVSPDSRRLGCRDQLAWTSLDRKSVV